MLLLLCSVRLLLVIAVACFCYAVVERRSQVFGESPMKGQDCWCNGNVFALLLLEGFWCHVCRTATTMSLGLLWFVFSSNVSMIWSGLHFDQVLVTAITKLLHVRVSSLQKRHPLRLVFAGVIGCRFGCLGDFLDQRLTQQRPRVGPKIDATTYMLHSQSISL